MQQLRIGIDGYHLAMHPGAGVADYGVALAHALRASGHAIEGVFGLDVGDDPALREILFYDRLGRPPRRTARDTLRLLSAARPALELDADEVPITARVETRAFADRLPAFDRLTSSAHLFDIAHRHFRVYRRFVRLRMPDPPPIMHWTAPVPVLLAGARNIYTLHDSAARPAPDRRIVRGCIAAAAQLCTVSEAGKAAIVARHTIDPARVTNAGRSSPLPAGVLADDPADDAAMIAGIFGLPPHGYLLAFGSAPGRLLDAHRAIGTATPLVIVGAGGGTSASAPGAARRLDRLPRALLLRLIRSARAVAVLDEDDALRVLDAMQLGTPVLTARSGALAELAGDAALAIDPHDAAAIAAALRAIDRDPALRARLSAAGRARAAAFSEERHRTRLDAMYANVLAAPDPFRGLAR